MFSIGQLVFYGQTGVCEVVNICEKEIVRGQKREYYELKPIYQSASVIFCPTDSEKVNIRPIISYDEAKKLIELIPTITTDEFKADEQRRLTEKYSAALKGQSCEELISLTKAIYEKKQTAMEKNKKIGSMDEHYMKKAEELLFGELAVALGIDITEITKYIEKELEK